VKILSGTLTWSFPKGYGVTGVGTEEEPHLLSYSMVHEMRLEPRGVSYAAYGVCHVLGKAERESNDSRQAVA
jgi:hypothetical protein